MAGKTMGPRVESYNILPKYLQALQLFVPGTIVKIQTIPVLDEFNQPIPNKVIFHRLFWSFKACIDAFAFCKPIVQIDGTWLYGRYKGTLLVAIAQDGANNIFPLAFAIVEGETSFLATTRSYKKTTRTTQHDLIKYQGSTGPWHGMTENVLVKATYEKLNKYFIDRGTQADAMITSRKVYTLIVAKFLTKEETKSNTHFV
ncbi:hypothetical protein GmHk_06G017141 [Glycine max]|nr:hypothetical protein GmHk_06G017141 [Glycine max]